jgi:hypothetical protein
MAIDRRSLLIVGGAALVSPSLRAEGLCEAELFAAACREPSGSYAAVAYAEGCGIRQRVALPARGHDLVQRPGTRECVVFARRPGTFAVAFGADGAHPPIEFRTRTDRHFFGHGAFASNGRLLLTSENDFEAARGVIGVRDATGGYRQIGEIDAGGMEPHDIVLLSDGRTLVVANGGLETHPDAARENLNVPTMEPSLAYIDIETGDVLEVHRLPPALHKLSIRHLALAAGDVVVFGCQYEGPMTEHPPLVGMHRRGEDLRLVEAADGVYQPMRNYVGSVAADASGAYVAATSPRGGLALIVDAGARRICAQHSLSDVCGVAPRHVGAGFWLTSGSGASGNLHRAGPRFAGSGLVFASHHENVQWDNHAIHIDA